MCLNTKMTSLNNDILLEGEEKQKKITELREIISNAQETISSATQLLSAIQGTIPEEMPINQVEQNEDDENAIYGYFDGQIMIGDDGKQYPVPANYASKSKLVEGDKLKLNITPDNKFVYKQIGPVPRNYLIGVVKKDAKGNFTIQTPEKEYQVLLAAATYFKIEVGDEVTLIVPQGKTTIWGAIENVLQKNTSINSNTSINTLDDSNNITTENNITNEQDTSTNENTKENINNLSNLNTLNLDTEDDEPINLSALEKLELELEKEKNNTSKTESKISAKTEDAPNAWASDIDKLRAEAGIAVKQ